MGVDCNEIINDRLHLPSVAAPGAGGGGPCSKGQKGFRENLNY